MLKISISYTTSSLIRLKKFRPLYGYHRAFWCTNINRSLMCRWDYIVKHPEMYEYVHKRKFSSHPTSESRIESFIRTFLLYPTQQIIHSRISIAFVSTIGGSTIKKARLLQSERFVRFLFVNCSYWRFASEAKRQLAQIKISAAIKSHFDFRRYFPTSSYRYEIRRKARDKTFRLLPNRFFMWATVDKRWRTKRIRQDVK